MARIAVIIPTLNEAENIAPLLQQLSTILAFSIDEIVFVDDDSTDETRARILSWRGQPAARLVARNKGERGLAGAIMAGAESISADLLVVMDADLSHPPERIPELLGPVLADEADLVIGSRYIAGGTTPGWPLWRRTMSRTAAAMAFPLTFVHDSLGGFFAVRREILLRHGVGAAGFKIAFELIVRSGKSLRIREIPIAFRDRARGQSKMSWREIRRFTAAWLGAVAHRSSVSASRPISPAKAPPQS